MGVIPFWQHFDKSVRMGQLRRFVNLLVCRVQLAVADILHDRPCKQVGVLEHNTQRPAQIGPFDLIDVDTVIADFAVSNIIKSVNQIGNRCFSCACRTDKSNLLPWLCIK